MDLLLLGNKSTCVGLLLESKTTKVKSEAIIHYRGSSNCSLVTLTQQDLL